MPCYLTWHACGPWQTWSVMGTSSCDHGTWILKGHLCGKIDFSYHKSKTPNIFRIFDFDLKPAQISENVPSLVLIKSYTGVLAKSSTDIGQIIYRYW